MHSIGLSNSDLDALTANYPMHYPECWKRASRIRTTIELEIDYLRLYSRFGTHSTAGLPPEYQRWKTAKIHTSNITYGGIRLHAPERLHYLLNFAGTIQAELLIYKDQAWLLSFESASLNGLKYDMLAEWQELSTQPTYRELAAADEQVHDPAGRHRTPCNQTDKILAGTAIMGLGMGLLAYVGASMFAVVPMLIGLALILPCLHKDILPTKRCGRLVRFPSMQHIALPFESDLQCYRCGHVLLVEHRRTLDVSSTAILYVDDSPGNLHIAPAYIDNQLTHWPDRDAFSLWVNVSLEPHLLAFPLVALLMFAGFNLLAVGGASFDAWLFGYSLSGACILLALWRSWRVKAKNLLFNSFNKEAVEFHLSGP